MTKNSSNKKTQILNKNKEIQTDEPEKNALFKNIQVLWGSIQINWLFWMTCFISVGILSRFNSENNSYINGYITFFIAMLVGWYIHYLSHAYDLLKIYKNIDNPVINYIKSKPMLNKIVENLIYYTCDFHDKIHHDTSVNKQPLNLVIEFIQNFLMEGGFLILLSYWSNFSIGINSSKFKFNRAILLLWGLLYASVHNINYILLGCDQHTKHHINPKTNYGIDALDILFDTKYDVNNIENLNHGTINVIIITLVIFYFKIYM